MTRELSRRRAIQAAAALMTASALPAQAQARGKPNIVFIMADDMGVADVSCYGRRDYQTPAIDSMAASGVRFLQAYANSPVCSASRTALITGRYQYRLPVGLEEPIGGPSASTAGLQPDEPTLPSLLKKVGYGTTLIGKWHLGALPKFGPLKSGYDHFFGFRSGAVDYFTHLNTNGIPDLWDGDVPFEQQGYLTDMIGARAIAAIEGYADSKRPFFLSVHFNAPHWPWEGPSDQAEAERLRGSSLRHFDGGTQKTYAAMVQAMDAQIGRILETLARRGIADNAIVIFTSDNGGERFADTWPFSGRKTELLEGGLRIPTIISWPAALPRGVVSNQVTLHMDWLPTLLEAAGAKPDARRPSDGIDLTPYMTGAAPISRTLYWRYKSNNQRAVRDGDYKYLKIRNNTFLFNVIDDPLERANLKDRRKDIYDRLSAQWRAWNATMLPERDETFGEGFNGGQLADHIGSPPAILTADPGN